MYLRPLLSVSTVFWQKVTKLFGQLRSATSHIHSSIALLFFTGRKSYSGRENLLQKPGRLSFHRTLAVPYTNLQSRKFVLLPFSFPHFFYSSSISITHTHIHHTGLLLLYWYFPLLHECVKNSVGENIPDNWFKHITGMTGNIIHRYML